MLQKFLSQLPISEILIAITAFFAPLKPLVAVVGLFIFADTVMGLYKAYKKGGYKSISSGKAAKGIGAKLILYTGAVVMVYLLEVFIIGDIVSMFFTIPFICTKIVSLIFCLIEMKSMDENYQEIYGYSLLIRSKDLIMKLKQVKDELKD